MAKVTRNKMQYIREKLDHRTILEQLAEEASELSQAALKVIRARGYSNNVTPVQPIAADFALEEEAVDVLMVLSLAGFNLEHLVHLAENSYKWDRCAQRLNDREEFVKNGCIQSE